MKIFSVDLKRLSDVVDKNVLKKWKYNTDKQGLDKEIKYAKSSGLVTNTAFNTKIRKFENKIPEKWWKCWSK